MQKECLQQGSLEQQVGGCEEVVADEGVVVLSPMK